MDKFQFGSIGFDYSVERSPKRSTISIIVDPQQGVIVKTPSDTPKEKIHAILRRKMPWIHRKLKDLDKLVVPQPAREYVSGESFSYLGRHYRLKVNHACAEGDEEVKLEAGRFVTCVPHSASGELKETLIREILMGWYVQHAEDRLSERMALYAPKLDVKPSAMVVKQQAKRWGSCTKRGVVNLNWRIIMAPMSIVDYVVVHELCHLRYENHTPEFWRALSSVLPDYEMRRLWLRVNGASLTI